MDCSTPGFPVLHYLLEFAQTHAHRVDDAIQPTDSPSHPQRFWMYSEWDLLMLMGYSVSKSWKFWESLEYQTTWPASWETYMQVRKQRLELDMEQQTGSK